MIAHVCILCSSILHFSVLVKPQHKRVGCLCAIFSIHHVPDECIHHGVRFVLVISHENFIWMVDPFGHFHKKCHSETEETETLNVNYVHKLYDSRIFINNNIFIVNLQDDGWQQYPWSISSGHIPYAVRSMQCLRLINGELLKCNFTDSC